MNETEFIELIKEPWFSKWEQWILFAFSFFGTLFSILAFIAAKRAVQAAKAAATTVKIQTITIEISEIVQRLDKLDSEMNYSEARDFFSEINRRVRRITAPFQNNIRYKEAIITINKKLVDCKEALDGVRPIEDVNSVVENAVYYAVEARFSDLSGELAGLMGLFEKRSLDEH